MIAGRPAPRWAAATVSYAIAALSAGIVLSAVENLPDLLSGGATITTGANAAIACLIYGAVAGLNLALPAIIVGLVFWWFDIDSLAATVVAAALIAGALVAAGFSVNDLELVPAAALGGLVFWACMRMAPAPVA